MCLYFCRAKRDKDVEKEKKRRIQPKKSEVQFDDTPSMSSDPELHQNISDLVHDMSVSSSVVSELDGGNSTKETVEEKKEPERQSRSTRSSTKACTLSSLSAERTNAQTKKGEKSEEGKKDKKKVVKAASSKQEKVPSKSGVPKTPKSSEGDKKKERGSKKKVEQKKPKASKVDKDSQGDTVYVSYDEWKDDVDPIIPRQVPPKGPRNRTRGDKKKKTEKKSVDEANTSVDGGTVSDIGAATTVSDVGGDSHDQTVSSVEESGGNKRRSKRHGKGGKGKTSMVREDRVEFEDAQGITDMRRERAEAEQARLNEELDSDEIISPKRPARRKGKDSKKGQKGGGKKGGAKKKNAVPKQAPVRLSAEKSDEAIDFIQQYPMMWDKYDDQWINRKRKAELWQQLADMCERTVEQMKRWWKNNRDEFNRMHGIKEQSGAGALKIRSSLNRWRWRRLQFYAYHRYGESEPLVKIPIKKRRAGAYVVPSPRNDVEDEYLEDQENEEDGDRSREVEGEGEVEVEADEGRDTAGTPAVNATRRTNATPVATRSQKRKGNITEQLLDQMRQFMKKSEDVQSQLRKPSNVKEGFGHYVGAWLSSLTMEQFLRARAQINTLISNFDVTAATTSTSSQQPSRDLIREAATAANVPQTEVDDEDDSGLPQMSNPTESRQSRQMRYAQQEGPRRFRASTHNTPQPSPRDQHVWPTNWEQNIGLQTSTAGPPPMMSSSSVVAGPQQPYMAPNPQRQYHDMGGSNVNISRQEQQYQQDESDFLKQQQMLRQQAWQQQQQQQQQRQFFLIQQQQHQQRLQQQQQQLQSQSQFVPIARATSAGLEVVGVFPAPPRPQLPQVTRSQSVPTVMAAASETPMRSLFDARPISTPSPLRGLSQVLNPQQQSSGQHQSSQEQPHPSLQSVEVAQQSVEDTPLVVEPTPQQQDDENEKDNDNLNA